MKSCYHFHILGFYNFKQITTNNSSTFIFLLNYVLIQELTLESAFSVNLTRLIHLFLFANAFLPLERNSTPGI